MIAWNCCRGPLSRKLAALSELAPDVAVLSEAPEPEAESEQVAWFPSSSGRLGVQVRSFGRYRVQKLPSADLPNCVNPVSIYGPTEFTLLAVWTWPAPTYLQALLNGLDAYAPHLSQAPIVVAGDFNGNPSFDKPRGRAKWSDAFAKLSGLGLVSAYHFARQVDFGHEPDATHLFQRKPARPFHIDYCFVPKVWGDRGITASLPALDDWLPLSDHLPLVVDVDAL